MAGHAAWRMTPQLLHLTRLFSFTFFSLSKCESYDRITRSRAAPYRVRFLCASHVTTAAYSTGNSVRIRRGLYLIKRMFSEEMMIRLACYAVLPHFWRKKKKKTRPIISCLNCGPEVFLVVVVVVVVNPIGILTRNAEQRSHELIQFRARSNRLEMNGQQQWRLVMRSFHFFFFPSHDFFLFPFAIDPQHLPTTTTLDPKSGRAQQQGSEADNYLTRGFINNARLSL